MLFEYLIHLQKKDQDFCFQYLVTFLTLNQNDNENI